ncbi:MAG: hypothetical protein MH204_05815 [Fimbriimonadaceae bacterium]|nr:hypothetical protein [Fimbriimonadaceae bacterium]
MPHAVSLQTRILEQLILSLRRLALQRGLDSLWLSTALDFLAPSIRVDRVERHPLLRRNPETMSTQPDLLAIRRLVELYAFQTGLISLADLNITDLDPRFSRLPEHIQTSMLRVCPRIAVVMMRAQAPQPARPTTTDFHHALSGYRELTIPLD